MDVQRTIVDTVSLSQSYESNQEVVQEPSQREATQLSADPLECARLMAAFNNAFGLLKDDNRGPKAMSSTQNAIAARLQSAMVEAALGGDDNFGLQLKPAQANAQEVKFDNFDWLGWLPVGFKKLFPPKPFDFRQPAPAAEAIGDKFRIAVFGDWGSGLYGALPISKAISEDPGYQLVLHLGDTYYSGTEREMQERLADHFPNAASAVGRSLNGNHEMYSGGIPYIKTIDTLLGQKSSCVAWQNANWLLVGLDTAYWDDSTGKKDHNLNAIQMDWLTGLLDRAGSRKVMLFSHHQPFSRLDSQGERLVSTMKSLLESGRIHTWFWGHEHRCVVYNAHPKWGLRGRCIGHGGFPEFRETLGGGDTLNWKGLSAKQENGTDVPASQILDGPNRFITDNPSRYSPHGFVTLEFDGANLREIYREADGNVLPDPGSI